ncbi:E3 ubiquitin-protein ligase RSL1 [Rhodamnia argentea]|uniref:RBR-type E3 ubiquitin transferase n=1 Tax=Rhodamnia argentea TaxID=178133 RepID=A0A8B8NN77_9MYRT|nr:E3 ubiquitin-protein ligase RSL1 [Rhodamnia argentea]
MEDIRRLHVDDFYFSALYDEEEIFPISDEKYALEVQLQEVLVISSSVSLRSNASTRFPIAGNTSFGNWEAGECSRVFCPICMEEKSSKEMFRGSCCTHSFCMECMGQYVASKIKENEPTVTCPDMKCKSILEPHVCRLILPQEVLDRWENVLSESLILGSQKFYCPFKDCSVMLVDDGGEVVTMSECPSCRRLFCAQCKVAWHVGMDCKEFQMMKRGAREEDLDKMMTKLAESNRWRRCPNCKFYVDKVDGCQHISCRCGHQFCYGCGGSWRISHSCLGSRISRSNR